MTDRHRFETLECRANETMKIIAKTEYDTADSMTTRTTILYALESYSGMICFNWLMTSKRFAVRMVYTTVSRISMQR